MKNKEMMKAMMRQQGMGNISDEQLEMMEKMMTPEMLRSMGSMDLNAMAGMRRSMSMPTESRPSNASSSPEPTQPEVSSQSAPPQPPNFDDLLQNKDMIKNAMEMIKQNPAMLRSMMAMAPGNPLAKFIEGKSDKQLAGIVSVMSGAIKAVLFLMPAVRAVNRFKYQIMALLVIFIFYKFFM